MAFENSIHCNDYISEKLWRNALRTGAVPVIFGPHRDDVKEMAPENSYIHVEDFTTPKELVKYLNYLNTNDTAYLEYHKWRSIKPRRPDTHSKMNNLTCQLCLEIKRRKAANWAKKTIKSVASWWWRDVHDDKCTGGYKLPDWIKELPIVKMNETYDEAPKPV